VKKIKCVKKPIVVEAIEIDDDFIKELPKYVEDTFVDFIDGKVRVNTLEGDMKAVDGDFIIIGVNGECYPIKREIFFKTYDLIPQMIIVSEEFINGIRNSEYKFEEFFKNYKYINGDNK
jgi:phospholipid N-methyltransferase